MIDAIGFAQANGAKVINASYGSLASSSSFQIYDQLTYAQIKRFP